MFPISVTCPCGFEAKGPDSTELYRQHTCAKAAISWPSAAAMIALFVVVGLIVEVIVS